MKDPPDLFADHCLSLQQLVTALEHRLNRKDAEHATAGQADLIRRWCKATRQLYDPAWWTSAFQAHQAAQAAQAATTASNQAARDQARNAEAARQLAAEARGMHHVNHPPVNLDQ